MDMIKNNNNENSDVNTKNNSSTNQEDQSNILPSTMSECGYACSVVGALLGGIIFAFIFSLPSIIFKCESCDNNSFAFLSSSILGLLVGAVLGYRLMKATRQHDPRQQRKADY